MTIVAVLLSITVLVAFSAAIWFAVLWRRLAAKTAAVASE